MSFLESNPRLELTKKEMEWVREQVKKQTRRPKLRELQQREDREFFVSILKIIKNEGHMTKNDIMDLTSWTPSQYGPRMTKLKKDHPYQIKYNKNLKRIDKVKSSKKQSKLK